MASTPEDDKTRALLESIDLVTFDCFGTLIDWRQALPALGVLLDQLPVFLAESERQQRPRRRDAPFIEYRSLLEHVGAVLRPDVDAETIRRWARAFGMLPFFPDAPPAIALLGRVVDVGVVSNCDAVHQLDVAQRLGRAWDVAVVAEELEAYKPTDPAWDRAVTIVERRGYERSRWLHVSAWDDYDLAPAAARGIRTAYVPRPDARPPRAGAVDASFADLGALARAFASAKQGPMVYEVEARAKDAATMARYIGWMTNQHLAEVRACQGVTSVLLVQVEALRTRAVYEFTGRPALARFVEKDAPRMRARRLELFADDDVSISKIEGTVLHAT